MLNIFRQLIDWLYIKKCYFCRQLKNNCCFCEDCYDDVGFLQNFENDMLDEIKVYSACRYEETPKKLIHLLKYKNKKELAKYQAELMYKYLKTTPLDEKEFCIIPVPLHFTRKWERGYNHMELVAKELCKLTNKKMNLKLIKRTKNTKPQFKLSNKQRAQNLKNAFSVDTKRFNNKSILIIDDVITTGSTIKEIIKELKTHQISDITVLTFCTTKL